MKTGMAANYIAMGCDRIVRMDRGADNLWIEIDGVRVQVVRDGTDEEPEVCVRLWAAETLDAGRGDPLATACVKAQ